MNESASGSQDGFKSGYIRAFHAKLTNHLTLDKYHFFKKENFMLLYAWRSQNTQGKEDKALQRSQSPSDAECSL